MREKVDDSDDFILDLLAKDNALACTLLYRRYYRAIFNYVNAMIGNPEPAKDIVQELFVAIWEKRHVLNFTRPLGKYMFAAAHNKALNYLRDAERTHTILGQIVNRSGNGKTSPAADVDLEAQELSALIKTAMNLLPFKAKRAFIMSRKYGMTYPEIAKRLLVTDKAVEKNISKALALLRKFLSDYLKIILFI